MRKIDVDHPAATGTRVGQAQTDTDVAQNAKLLRAFRCAAPDLADIGERRGSDAKQAERIPVGVEALLDGQQGTAFAIGIAKRVATQTVVAAERDLLVEIEVPTHLAAQVDMGGCEVIGPMVIASVDGGDFAGNAVGFQATIELRRHQPGLRVVWPFAVGQRPGIDPRAPIGAEAGGCQTQAR